MISAPLLWKKTGSTFLTVEKENTDGTWEVVHNDDSLETRPVYIIIACMNMQLNPYTISSMCTSNLNSVCMRQPVWKYMILQISFFSLHHVTYTGLSGIV